MAWSIRDIATLGGMLALLVAPSHADASLFKRLFRKPVKPDVAQSMHLARWSELERLGDPAKLTPDKIAARIDELSTLEWGSLPRIGSGELKDFEAFDLSHPGRDQGNGEGLKLATWNEKRVLIKPATLVEARMAMFLGEMGIGIPFVGVPGHCGQCYAVEYEPEAFVLKSWRIDGRYRRFAQKGFLIQPETQARMEEILTLLGQMNIYAGDAQFLITPDGRVRLFDPGEFRYGEMSPGGQEMLPPVRFRIPADEYSEDVIRLMRYWIKYYNSEVRRFGLS
jgi:hypothetical protein